MFPTRSRADDKTGTIRLEAPIAIPRAEGSARSPELVLLVMTAAFLAVNWLAMALQRPDAIGAMAIRLSVWIACAFGGRAVLARTLPHRDPLLFPIVMLLTGWGIVMTDRLLPVFAERQTVWLILGVIVLVAIASFQRTLLWLRRYRYLILFGGLALLVATIALGTNPSETPGAPTLWLRLGTVFFQPSELLKVILVAFLASYLGEQVPLLRAGTLPGGRFAFSPRVLGPILLMWGVSVVMLVWQRDLGTAILFFLVFVILIYVASGSAILLAMGGALVAGASIVAYRAFAVVRLRVDVWWNPWPEADDRAYQIVQSLYAFAAGGTFGQGIGQGVPGFIPVVHSDFALAALAEEWGYLGVIVVLAAIALLVARGLLIAVQQRGQPFYTLLAVGLSALIGVQSLLITGGVLKLIPLTGVTLPFLSYGGSSLVVSFAIVGLLLRLSSTDPPNEGAIDMTIDARGRA